MRNNIFSVHAKAERPLSNLLWQRARELLNAASSARTLDDLEPFVGDELATTITAHRLEAPKLGSVAPARTGPGADREVSLGHRIPTTRIFYSIHVSGDGTVLEYWPDRTGAGLRPANQDLIDEIGNPRDASDDDSKRYFDSIEIWSLVDVPTPDGTTTVLATFEDMTADEIGDPDAHSQVRDRFKARHADAELIAAAINDQLDDFYGKELPETLRARAGARRKHLENLGNLFNTLGLPAEWKTPPPKIVAVTEPVIEGLPVHTRWRLDPVSYEDIQRIVRLWANAVEDDPEAYTTLLEDHISSLLSATLNATTSGAGREVYSRGGKTDIRIRADIHGEDKGPASIFVLESKWVGGAEDIASAIEDQLMRYVPVAATSTVLLALSRNQNFSGAVESIYEWAEAVPGYVERSDGAVQGWPVFKYVIAELDNLEMDVCIATVSLAPIPQTRARKRSASG